MIESSKMIEPLNQFYSGIFEKELIEEIARVGTLKSVREGEKIIEIGEYVKVMPLLLEGAIKILREDKEGDELLLYFLSLSLIHI